MAPLLVLAAALLGASPQSSAWEGVWTYDLCHEDRRADHDADTYCRQGRDRILIEQDRYGAWEITLCPADPWGERDVAVGDGGRVLGFTTREGNRVRLTLGQDGAHFTGRFRSAGGHAGRVWGRRVAGC